MLTLTLAVLGLVVVLGVTAWDETAAEWDARGGRLLLVAALAAMAGTYLLLITILLTARPTLLEHAVGQDRLLQWHRRIAPVALVLLFAHACLVIAGEIRRSTAGAVLEAELLRHTSVMTATIGLVLLILAAVTSSVLVFRDRLRHRTWWTVHLLVYPATALSFWHTLAGSTFPGHRLVHAGWLALWLGAAGAVLYYRVLVPVTRTLRHRLVVTEVRTESPGVVSIVCQGRYVDRIGVWGGQYFQWRFLVRHLIWHAHPYSVSAMPGRGTVRLTVKRLGRASGQLQDIRIGSSVLIEGPYGRFTKYVARTRRLVLVGSGIGVAPIRALLEDLSPRLEITVLVLAADEENLVFQDEMEQLARARGATMHVLLGGRTGTVLDRELLARLCPGIAESDVFVCGSPRFSRSLIGDARSLGTPLRQIHHEDFG